MLAGCLGDCIDLSFVGTGLSDGSEIATEPVESVPGGTTVLTLADLPEKEQSLVAIAVEIKPVRVCMSENTDRSVALARSRTASAWRRTSPTGVTATGHGRGCPI